MQGLYLVRSTIKTDTAIRLSNRAVFPKPIYLFNKRIVSTKYSLLWISSSLLTLPNSDYFFQFHKFLKDYCIVKEQLTLNYLYTPGCRPIIAAAASSETNGVYSINMTLSQVEHVPLQPLRITATHSGS